MQGAARRSRRGRLVSAVGWIWDCTEDEARHSRLRLLERAAEATTDAILVADARRDDMPLILVNNGFERMSGYRREEVLGRNCRFLQRDDRDQEGVRILREAIDNRRTAAVLLRNYRSDGTLFWNKLSVAPVYDGSDSVSHYVGVATDVSAEIEAERARRQLEQKLQQAERVQQVAAIASSIAHDVKGTLVPILTLSQLLHENSALPEDARDMARRINRAGSSIRGLINSAVNSTRFAELRRERLDLAAHVRSSIEIIGAGIPASIELRVVGDDPVWTLACPMQLYQVIQNLVTNSAQAIGDRKGEIELAVEKGGGGRACLAVRDTGEGMDEEVRARALEPFFSLRSSGGRGMGLTIVQAIVEEHGGDLTLWSAPGEGTCVEVWLPAARDERLQ